MASLSLRLGGLVVRFTTEAQSKKKNNAWLPSLSASAPLRLFARLLDQTACSRFQINISPLAKSCGLVAIHCVTSSGVNQPPRSISSG